MKAALEEGCLVIFCPGCGHKHHIAVNGLDPAHRIQWKWNNDLFHPTLEPSVRYSVDERTVCHFHIENGFIRFVNDYWHPLAGQTIELPDLKYN